jgi:lipopolysaccharide export LptBFGC system permease protein LptF
MFLTSMGIFGFLSKAHIEQGTPTGDIAANVALIDEKIKTERENIDAARKAITQLDAQVDKFTQLGNVTRSVQARQQQQKERGILLDQIQSSQSTIAKLNEEKSVQSASLRKVEAEVGPIKYIAALIYGDEATSDTALLEKAVRWVTILIVAVFDPLAVLMLIAANWSLAQNKSKQSPPVERTIPSTIPKQTNVVLKKKIVEKTEPTVTPESEQSAPVESSKDVKEHPAFEPGDQYWKSRPKKKY